MQHLGWR
jgi:hypothetical protein